MDATFEDGPNFEWQQKPFEQQGEVHNPHITADTVVTTVKNIINTLLNKTEAPTTITSEMPQVNFEQNSVTDAIVGVQETTSSIITEILQDNSKVLVPIVEETTNSSIITEILQDNTIFEATTIGIQETTSSSIITEVLQNNNTVLDTNNTIFTGVTDTINTVVTATEDTITSTSSIFTDTSTNVYVTETSTESMVTTVSDAVTKVISSTTDDGEIYTNTGYHDEIEDKTLIIVLGVILAVLITVMIILLIIYKRYKSRNCARSGVYCVTDLNEISIASPVQKEISTEY